MAVHVVTDYSSGLTDGDSGIRVVGPDPEKRRFGDPPSRQEYLAAFQELVPRGPTPVLCLVGPYGDSPAFTAAAAARNELGRSKIDPNLVHVVNASRSFLGLGALALAVANSGLDPEAALRWIDEAGPDTSLWAVAETAKLDGISHEWQLEAPNGLPDDDWTLLRIRLASRVMAGFPTREAAEAAARAKSSAGARTMLEWPGGRPEMPPFAVTGLGLKYAVASAPTYPRSGAHA